VTTAPGSLFGSGVCHSEPLCNSTARSIA
jgi:hypothetical protein